MAQSNARPVVIDNGSGLCKAGFAGDNRPRIIIPAIVGRPKNGYTNMLLTPTDNRSRDSAYIGLTAQRKRGVLNLKYPIEHGIINNWEDMVEIWDYVVCNLMNIDPSEHPFLMTDAPMNPRQSRENMVEIWFERYKVPAFYVSIQAILSLYATSRTTGIVLDSGDGVTHVVPIYDGFIVPHGIDRINLAGRDLTRYLSKLLTEDGVHFSSTAELEIVRDIKEKLCYVALDPVKEEVKYRAMDEYKKYELPDGNILNIGNQRYRVPEALFNPTLLGKEVPGVHECIFNSITKCDMDIRRNLASNIVLSGGSVMFDGIEERMYNELRTMFPSSLNCFIDANKDRQFKVFAGGSILASLSTFKDLWITKQQYEEHGPKIVHSKCF